MNGFVMAKKISVSGVAFSALTAVEEVFLR